MDRIFRNTLAVDFTGVCVFDWTNLGSILDRFATSSLWFDPQSPHWQSFPELSDTVGRMEHARSFMRNVGSFFTDSEQAPGNRSWGGLSYYTGFCNAILLDCVNHAGFQRVVAALQSAGAELNRMT